VELRFFAERVMASSSIVGLGFMGFFLRDLQAKNNAIYSIALK
jgi:hypothetical protein